MAIIETAREGDCVASIAARHGFSDPKSIYDHPDNAELREHRPNFNVLMRGDQVVVRDRDPKEEDASTGGAKTFKVKIPQVEIAVQLLDEHDEPFADQKFRLVLPKEEIDGTTDGDGFVRAKVPADLTAADLMLWLDDPDAEEPSCGFQLQIGSLAPAKTARGVQSRLTNLGYWCGAIDGRVGRRTQHALRAFQAKHGLKITGEPDDATLDKLVETHGC